MTDWDVTLCLSSSENKLEKRKNSKTIPKHFISLFEIIIIILDQTWYIIIEKVGEINHDEIHRAKFQSWGRLLGSEGEVELAASCRVINLAKSGKLDIRDNSARRGRSAR